MNPPPSCNTGVATPLDGQSQTAGSRPFSVVLDYLAAHVHAPAQTVVDGLCAHLGLSWEVGTPRHNYTHCAHLVASGEVWARVYYAHDGHPWLQVPGSDAQLFIDAIKALGWQYRPTRLDSALDVHDPDAFPILVAAAKAFAHQYGLKVEHAGDWEYAQKGRTLYVGARTSKWFLRLYEKGRKERTDPSWIRCEVEYHPDHESERALACDLTAGQLWCMKAFKVWGKVLGLTLDDVFDYTAPPSKRVRRDLERAKRAMAAQYLRTVEAWLEEVGGDPHSFVHELLQLGEEQKLARRWDKAASVVAPGLNP